MSLNIVKVDPGFTLGQRALKRKQVIDKLETEGLIDQNKALELSLVPQNIAVISSATAAGYEDFVNQLVSNDLGYAFRTKLFPAIMQGNEAVNSIISAFQQISAEIEYFDCVVMIRGGGAQLDLDCFDSYDLAVEMALFPLPIITGIGHQRDETVADMVAWIKMKTPTATAGFILDRVRNFEENILHYYEGISTFVRKMTNDQKVGLKKIQLGLNRSVNVFTANKNRELSVLAEQLKNGIKQLQRNKKHQLELIKASIMSYDPKFILQRGYTFTTINGKIINKVDEIKSGDEMKTYTTDLIIKSTVTEKSKTNG